MSWGTQREGGWLRHGDSEAGNRFTQILRTILEVVPGGVIRAGKTAYSDDSNVGFWIGVDSDGLAKINVGGATAFLKWTGSALQISGQADIQGDSLITGTLAVDGDILMLEPGTTWNSEADPGDAIGWVGVGAVGGAAGKWLGYNAGVLQAYLDSDGTIKWAGGAGTLNSSGISLDLTSGDQILFQSTDRGTIWIRSAMDSYYDGGAEVLRDVPTLNIHSFASVGDGAPRYAVVNIGAFANAAGGNRYVSLKMDSTPGASPSMLIAGSIGFMVSVSGSLQLAGGLSFVTAQRILNLADATADTDALNRRSGDGRYVQRSAGWSGTFTTGDAKTVTVVDGQITGVV